MNRHYTGRILLSAAIALASTSMLSGCGTDSDKTQDQPTAAATGSINDVNTVATVNGHPITVEQLTFYLKTKQAANPEEALNPPLILNEMINRELLREEAEKQGIEQRDDVKQLLQIERTSLLVNTLIADKLKSLDLSDEALKKEYDEQVKNLDLKEYKASHILLETKEDAETAIKELKDGADFAELAKKKSTGPTGANGGDLGWFDPASMVPEFGDAVKGMQKGQITETPVKTQFGWHVIKLVDVKEKQPPSFESTKERLKTIVSNKAVQQYLSETRTNADVQIKKAQGSSADSAATKDTESAPEAPAASKTSEAGAASEH